MRIVNPPELMKPRGFAYAALAAGAVYLGGHTAHDGEGLVQGETLIEQFGAALGNLVVTLRASGGEPEDLAWLQVFVTDMDEYRRSTRELGPVWGRQLGRHYPAMGLFGVTALADPAARVELMGIAVIER